MLSNNKKIVLAEDDAYLSKAYKDGLGRAGFDVIVVTDGEEAIKMIKSERPDLVLLDLVMPVKKGLDVLREMRADDTVKDIPVLVFSNLSQEIEIIEAKNLGAVGYLVKSDLSMMEEVIGKIRSVLDPEGE